MFKRVDHMEIVPKSAEKTMDFYGNILNFKIKGRSEVKRPPVYQEKSSADLSISSLRHHQAFWENQPQLKTQKRDLFDIKTGKRQDEKLEAGKKEADMILTQILLFIVVAMMVVILYKLHSIKQHQSLKDVFIDNFTPSHGSPKMVNIPYEISKLRMELAPLFYLPMASEAKDLKNLETFVDDENRMRNQIYLRAEISEMEEHVKSHSPSEPFPASDSLKEALKQWAIAVTNRGRVDKLVQEYKQRLINVVSGNVFVEQAEKSLRKTPSFVPGWLIMDEDKPGVEELCKQRAENWKAGKWLEHLESLREFSKMKADS